MVALNAALVVALNAPRVAAGNAISVGDVLSYRASGRTEAEILADFSWLTHEDILAC